jgi:hypothetical protein
MAEIPAPIKTPSAMANSAPARNGVLDHLRIHVIAIVHLDMCPVLAVQTVWGKAETSIGAGSICSGLGSMTTGSEIATPG